VVTLLAFDAAISVAANVSLALSGRMDPVQDVLGGLAGGLVGSGLMALAALVLRVGSRRMLRWLPLVAVGTVLGMLLAVDSYLHSDNVWVLFPAWQAAVAFILMRTLRKPD
jgi:predicted membrane protein